MRKRTTYYAFMSVIGIGIGWLISFSPYTENFFRFEILLLLFLSGFLLGRMNTFFKDYELAKHLENRALSGKYNFNDIDVVKAKIFKHLQSKKISQDEYEFLITKLNRIDIREKQNS